MHGFTVLDSSGNLRVTPYPSGVQLPDPVTVAHGGLGLTSCAQGDLFYGSAAGAVSALAKDTGGLRLLANQGGSGNPSWIDPVSGLTFIPIATTRKPGWIVAQNGSTTPVTVALPASTDFASGTVTAVTDTTSNWIRHATSTVAGNNGGIRYTADLCWLDHLPLIRVYLRTGAAITNTRWWITLNNGAAVTGNSDDQHALKGVGIRYSTGAGDGGWVPWTSDGTTQTIGSTITTVAVSTIYLLEIKVTATNSVTLTVNGSSQTVAVPAGALGTGMRLNAQVTTTDTVSKTLDLSAHYAETN